MAVTRRPGGRLVVSRVAVPAVRRVPSRVRCGRPDVSRATDGRGPRDPGDLRLVACGGSQRTDRPGLPPALRARAVLPPASRAESLDHGRRAVAGLSGGGNGRAVRTWGARPGRARGRS